MEGFNMKKKIIGVIVGILVVLYIIGFISELGSKQYNTTNSESVQEEVVTQPEKQKDKNTIQPTQQKDEVTNVETTVTQDTPKEEQPTTTTDTNIQPTSEVIDTSGWLGEYYDTNTGASKMLQVQSSDNQITFSIGSDTYDYRDLVAEIDPEHTNVATYKNDERYLTLTRQSDGMINIMDTPIGENAEIGCAGNYAMETTATNGTTTTILNTSLNGTYQMGTKQQLIVKLNQNTTDDGYAGLIYVVDYITGESVAHDVCYIDPIRFKLIMDDISYTLIFDEYSVSAYDTSNNLAGVFTKE
jgi:hypothetical protein